MEKCTTELTRNPHLSHQVNPEISSGLPIPALNRYPQPASRPERYSTPATKASDPAFNPVSSRVQRQPTVLMPEKQYLISFHRDFDGVT
jgi:hypothetical protein